MNRLTVSPLLRFALRLDAVATLVSGALTCLFVSRLQSEIGTAAAPVLAVGIFMLVYGVVVGVLSTLQRLPTWAVWTVILGNALWVIESILLSVSGWIQPSTVGLALLLAQAAAVAAFAELQYVGLRRSAAVAAT